MVNINIYQLFIIIFFIYFRAGISSIIYFTVNYIELNSTKDNISSFGILISSALTLGPMISGLYKNF